MMAYLALQSGNSQSREKLAALLWGGNTESQARMNLRQSLSVIRKAMGSADGGKFLTDGGSITLNLDDLDFDVARFEELAAGHTPEQLEQALVVYRGDLLDGFDLKEEPFEDWLRVERERLRTIAVAVLQKLVAHYSATNSLASGVRAATRLLVLEPLREDIHRALMQIYARQGRPNMALKQYAQCREVLRKHLQLEPEKKTHELYDKLRASRSAPSKQNPTPSARAEGSVPVDSQVSLRPETHYVKSGGVSVAYQVTGGGPFDLVYVQGWVSNLDYAWESPRLTHVLRRLGSFCRLVRIDKRGTGLSDRNVGFPTLQERADDVRAVLDAIGSRRTVLFGSSEGGVLCMLFAATYPERTEALILHGAYAQGLWSPDYPWAKTREEMEEELAAIERKWGEPWDLGRGAPSLVNDTHEQQWFAAYLRNSASPSDAIALWRWGAEVDVRNILHAIHVPTLILQRTGDRWIKVEEALYLSERIAGATLIELPGDDHLIWGADSDRLVDAIQHYLTVTFPAKAG
ncbi:MULTISPECIES: alpha/beta fold hydrolase [Mesorhizobium]|uniref:alpha/beta fold hydrolase n=1 Tax=Mesorhizobium TaxID=68287 RepID=UPI001FD9B41D|nr:MULTISPECIES: alpha/beta fold hydrolase [Mesorhizobium]WJI40502.1 alpha/beta fold hydrolase [Mesorhizobium opportunistum]